MECEKSIKELEEIVAKLSDKNISIDEAITLYENGVKLVKKNYEEIKEARGKVTELQKELDLYTETIFDEE